MTDSQHAQSIALTPVYHWRGARPFPLDLTADDTGRVTLLLLQREGEVCLIPLSWEKNLPAATPIRTPFYGDALSHEALHLTLNELRGDGWQVQGQLILTFTGRETDPNFWPQIKQALWQQSSITRRQS